MRILRDYKRPNQNIDWYADIMEVTAKDIIEIFGRPDVIWASPPCTSYSIAAISHHRKKNVETGSLDPVSDFAKLSDELVKHTLTELKAYIQSQKLLMIRTNARRKQYSLICIKHMIEAENLNKWHIA